MQNDKLWEENSFDTDHEAIYQTHMNGNAKYNNLASIRKETYKYSQYAHTKSQSEPESIRYRHEMKKLIKVFSS